jgi:hypothetical protein
MSPFRTWICLLALIGLAACAPTAALSPTPADTVMIRYHTSGGIAGTDDTWLIYTSGRVEHTGRSSSPVQKLSASHLAALTAAVSSPDVAALKESYVPTDTCCDRYLYEITLIHDGKTQTVRTLDATPDEPPALTGLRVAIEAALR